MQQLLSSSETDEKNRSPLPPVPSSLENVPQAPASSNNVPQVVPSTTKSARRVVIIRPEKKRKKAAPVANAPVRHLNPRFRQIFLIVTILVVFAGTLMTLIPLSTSQNGLKFLVGFSTWISSDQNNLELQAHETQVAASGYQGPTITLSHSQYVAIAEQDATNAGISPVYFTRQIQVESGFNPNAYSPGGAEGIAQFEPGTAAGLGINPWDPIQALQAAAQMMANLYHQYGDYAKALAAYNAGSANLNNAVRSCGSSWLSCMPAETQHYVATIMG